MLATPTDTVSKAAVSSALSMATTIATSKNSATVASQPTAIIANTAISDGPTEHAATSETLPFKPIAVASQLQSTHLQPLKMMVNLLMEAIVVVDEHGTIQLINEHALDLLIGEDLSSEQLNTNQSMTTPTLIGQQWQNYLLEPQKTLYQKMIIESRTGSRPLNHAPAETTLRLPNDVSKDVEVSITHFALSTPLFAIVIRDLTKYRAEYKQLHQWASTDCLTKLANRRVFDSEIQSHWKTCVDKGRPVSVLIIDIDHFKSFNDKYGHILGDYCLQKIARAIEASLPNLDCTAARYGGEEFAIILPNSNARQVAQTARLIQKNINDLSYMDIGLDASVSVSVSQGHASEINGQFRTSTALLCAADTALYRAKADGRNRINACV
ncbi:diguanylate cyclase [Shewanella sp. Choline-02u-19]|uniref:sensor domain-containing diguanylate cyclase n=1 Tax=unclassified Shewanella TaxID=196818 RepID=UPI000C33129E|nr:MULTISPECIES: GGDEF domain-containing protein [unclassified Shewanella]PKG58714.1 diguanylate cyclase [Shewanella sp. GutDb-MelDb]PKG74463.1 diguanylate cyclase [Shewanella sp. GutCb]PKH53847.1 diguanylate cyclase [Shewanella sp. Bg11-22]PKI28901.1 diguanylate cyclase [Shewanella sp. Choline-02u-19]